LDEITGGIVDSAYGLHKGLGPGLLESVYEKVLARDFQRRGFRVERQKQIAFEYEGLHFDDGQRVDLLVDVCVVVEIKSVERLLPVHPKQVLTYLRLLKLPVGLLINLGAPTLKQGLQRIVNGLDREAMERRSGRVSASPRKPNRRQPITTSPRGMPSVRMRFPYWPTPGLLRSKAKRGR
jgi:iron complex transport system substrate-binding protein